MSHTEIRPATAEDFDAILKLNAEAVKWTSPLDLARLQQLHAWSNYHKVFTVDHTVAAFLLVMPADVNYDSVNYQWFKQHYDDFYYVDRIVVTDRFTGHKIGSRLYQDLFATARQYGIKHITCEYNLVPINKPSEIFHQRFGFRQVGTQWLNNNSKQVSMQAADVAE